VHTLPPHNIIDCGLLGFREAELLGYGAARINYLVLTGTLREGSRRAEKKCEQSQSGD
jgi:hypothetical protein